MRGAPGERVAQVEELAVREVLEGGQTAGRVRVPLQPLLVGDLGDAQPALEVNSIALLKSQQTFQQTFPLSFYCSVGHPVVLKTLLKSLLRFQQSY